MTFFFRGNKKKGGFFIRNMRKHMHRMSVFTEESLFGKCDWQEETTAYLIFKYECFDRERNETLESLTTRQTVPSRQPMLRTL